MPELLLSTSLIIFRSSKCVFAWPIFSIAMFNSSRSGNTKWERYQFIMQLDRLGRISHCCLTTPSHYRHQCWLNASSILLRPTSQVVPWTLIREMSLKITLVKLLPYLPGANELIIPILYRHVWRMRISYIDGLVQDWSMSSALAMEIPQSYTKLSIYSSSQNDKDIVGNKLNAFLNRWLNWSRTHQCPLNGQDQTPWISLKHKNKATFTGKHDAVIKWKHFPRY